MIKLTTPKSTEDMIRDDPLFSVDGVEYSIPSGIPAAYGLELSIVFNESGLSAAQIYALKTCLGDKGFSALRSAKNISREDLSTIIDVCVGRLQGVGPKAG